MITNVEAAVHDYILKDLAFEYYRFQKIMETSINMASTAETDINLLIQYGKDLVNERNSEIKKAVQDIINEKLNEDHLLFDCKLAWAVSLFIVSLT